MKKRVLLLIAIIAISAVFASLFAFGSMAADEEIVIGYYETQSGSVKAVAVPNEDGSYTLRDTQFSKASTVTLADGTVVDREFYGWFTEEGDFYTPGQTVTFTESTKLYQAFGVTVYNFADLKKAFSAGGWVRLGCDIEGDNALTNGQTTSILDLNGFNYTVTNNQNASWGAELGAFGCTRGSYAIMGSGTITQGVRTKDTSNGKFFASFATHGYADENNPQDFWIGKNVKIVTPYPLLRVSNQPKLGMPDMKVAGTIVAESLLTGPSMQEGTLDIFESADITLTGKEMVTITTLNANPYTYLTVTIHGGKITMTNEEAMVVTDTMIECCDITVLGGSFAISQSGIEKLTPCIVEPLVLKETVVDGTVYQTVVEPDCYHDFVLDTEASVTATKTELGLDVFTCSKCGEKKESVAVYNPSSVEITVKVLVGEEIVEKTVTFGSVVTLEKNGTGADAYYIVTAVAETDGDGNNILSVQIPFGVAKVALASVKNSTVEEIEFLDGADARVSSVIAMKALKSIKIGAAKVVFSANCVSGENKVFESIVSDKAGADVTFEKQAFYYYDTCPVKSLVLVSGSTYYFGESCFAKSQIESLVFPDGATVSFTGNSAFNNSSKLKYVYLGDGVSKLNYRPFEYVNNLECVVVMCVAEFDDCAFRVDKAESAKAVLSVYVHTADITKIHKNAFLNRSNYGVKFYTVDPDIVALENCLYSVYNGIPHAYVDGVVREATCILPGIIGSVTDCPCAKNEIVTYTVYTAEGSEEFTTAQRETELSDVHVLGTVLANISYNDGYLAAGTKEYYCALCGVATVAEETPSAEPLFENQGYSVCEYSNGITQGFNVNIDIYLEIQELNPEFKYGVVAFGNRTGAEISPLKVTGGAVSADSENVIVVTFDEKANRYFDIKVIGISDEIKDCKIVFCAYVFDGTSIKYVDNGITSDTVTGVSYNEIANP